MTTQKEPKDMIKGVSPSTKTALNAQGAAQSQSYYRTDLVDPLAFFKLSEVLKQGHDKYNQYGFENWRRIPINDHLNHLLVHVYAYLAGDTEDEHLSHALCRAMFAVGVEQQYPRYIQNRREMLSDE